MTTPETLQHYLSTWGLTDPMPLAQTATSHLYLAVHEQATVVLKILTPVGVEERMGALALRHFDGHGAVRLLRSDDGAQLLEYADGEDLTDFVQHGEDETATEIIGEVINRLHANDATPPEGIMTLRRWFRALFLQADKDRKAGVDSIFIRAADRADKVLAEPREQRVLHGDIHHENIKLSWRGWLAFDPKGLYGERAYDLANTLCNPRPMYGVDTADEARILRNVEILAQKTGVERARILLFLHLYACLSASWTLENPETAVANITRIAEIAERYINR